MVQRRVRQVADMLTITAAAETLGVKYATCYKRLRRARVPTVIVGHTVLVRREDLEAVHR